MTKQPKLKKTKKKRGRHSSPNTSGEQNLPKQYVEKNKGSGGGNMEVILMATQHGSDLRQEYKGLWTNELLEKEVFDYFQYCVTKDMKPSKASLRLWLGISRSTYYEWENNPAKHSNKSDILQMANDFMQVQYISRGEQYPTFNQFLLKASHDYSDKQDITITATSDVSQDNILDTITKLGLNEGTD